MKFWNALTASYVWLEYRWWGRLVLVITAPVWCGLLAIFGCLAMIALAIWEGDPGDFIRWLWRGPNKS